MKLCFSFSNSSFIRPKAFTPYTYAAYPSNHRPRNRATPFQVLPDEAAAGFFTWPWKTRTNSRNRLDACHHLPVVSNETRNRPLSPWAAAAQWHIGAVRVTAGADLLYRRRAGCHLHLCPPGKIGVCFWKSRIQRMLKPGRKARQRQSQMRRVLGRGPS